MGLCELCRNEREKLGIIIKSYFIPSYDLKPKVNNITDEIELELTSCNKCERRLKSE